VTEPSSILDMTKLEIYKDLPKCEHHIQGCLIAEDGRHLKLNNEMIAIWARTIVNRFYNSRYIIILINNKFYYY